VIGYATDSYTTESLDQYSSTLLRFTPLVGNRPHLVGSNLHLSIGATEVDDMSMLFSTLKVKLSDAGAQAGALTFYSKKTLVAAGSKNCEISSVESLGDNLWKVHLTGRQWNKKQYIKLKVNHF
jgi:hypothetical protein